MSNLSALRNARHSLPLAILQLSSVLRGVIHYHPAAGLPRGAEVYRASALDGVQWNMSQVTARVTQRLPLVSDTPHSTTAALWTQVTAGNNEEVLAALTAVRNSVAADSSRLRVFPQDAPLGAYFRQGDIYITKIATPNRAEPADQSQRLAEGSATGARHELDSLQGVTVYSMPFGNELNGPVLHLTERRVVTHPQHAHVELPPGWYSVTYQRSFGEELRPVGD